MSPGVSGETGRKPGLFPLHLPSGLCPLTPVQLQHPSERLVKKTKALKEEGSPSDSTWTVEAWRRAHTSLGVSADSNSNSILTNPVTQGSVLNLSESQFFYL